MGEAMAGIRRICSRRVGGKGAIIRVMAKSFDAAWVRTAKVGTIPAEVTRVGRHRWRRQGQR